MAGHDFSAGLFLSVRGLHIAATTWYSGFSCCPLSRVLHVTLANLKKNWIWVMFFWGRHLHLVGIDHQSIHTSLLATPCWRNPTRSKQLFTVAIVGFQFGLYHVAVPLSFLRSISHASLLSIISMLSGTKLPAIANRKLTNCLKSCVNRFYSFVNVKVIFQNTRHIKSILLPIQGPTQPITIIQSHLQS